MCAQSGGNLGLKEENLPLHESRKCIYQDQVYSSGASGNFYTHRGADRELYKAAKQPCFNPFHSIRD
jgi:hypothetical protein